MSSKPLTRTLMHMSSPNAQNPVLLCHTSVRGLHVQQSSTWKYCKFWSLRNAGYRGARAGESPKDDASQPIWPPVLNKLVHEISGGFTELCAISTFSFLN